MSSRSARTPTRAAQAFNRGLFDLLIATDDPRLMRGAAGPSAGPSKTPSAEPSAEAAPGGDAPTGTKKGKRKAKDKGGPSESDAEFGVSRGVDFCDVTAVINMDLPTGMPIYRHRIGRTARAGAGGTAISMVVEGDNKEDTLLAGLQEAYGSQMHQFHVDMTKLAAFRRDA